jgi:iron complex transport system substrate-binding protein
VKKCLPTLLAAALALGLAACGQQTDSKTASDSTSQAAGEQIKLSSKAGEITIPANVSKIAVMDYTSLDTFVALGASDKVIGLPLSSAVPTSLASFKDGKYADFGAVNNVNLEKLAAAQPQLIISADRLQKQTDALKQIAPTYHYSIDTNNYWQSFHEQTLNLAKIVGKTTEAEQKLQALDAEAAKLSEKTKGKTALIVLVNNDKLMAFGQHSRFGLIHDKLGFTPADASIKVGTHGQSISYEYIAEKNPDYLFVIDRASAVTGKSGGAQAAFNNDIIKQSKAAKENHIVYLDANNWYLMNGGLNAMHEMVVEVGAAVK